MRDEGVALVRSALKDEQLQELLELVAAETADGAVRHRSGDTYGARGLLRSRAGLVERLEAFGVGQLAADAVGRVVFPIDALFFDKHPAANWAVPAHQDVVIPVPSDALADVVGRRRVRDGITYGEPPSSVLSELVAIRIHFDPSDENGGELQVVPGTHRGRVREADARALPATSFVPCLAEAGDALLMHPLVIHRSSKSLRDTRRRVLHVLYAPVDGWHARHRDDAA